MSKRMISLCWFFGFSVVAIYTPRLIAESIVSQQVLTWQDAAQDCIAKGDVAGAVVNYQNIIQSDSNTDSAFDAQVQIAQLHFKEKKYDSVRLATNQLLKKYSNRQQTVHRTFDIVQKCMYGGADSQALAICTDAQDLLSPDAPSARISGWQGMVLAHQKEFTQVDQVVNNLKNMDSNQSDFLGAMGNIGWGYFCVGQWDRALAVYRQGIERYPDHKGAASLQYHIVQTYLGKEDIKSASDQVQTLLTQYGNQDTTLGLVCRLAKEFRRKGQKQQAVEFYNKLLEQFPSHKDITIVQDALVETYADMGDLAKAQEALKADIEKYPGHKGLPRIITRVAVEIARTNDPNNEAMKLVDSIFAQKPQGAEQLFGYTTQARVDIYQNKDDKAKQMVDDMLLQFKDYPNDLTYHLFGVGEEFYYRAQKLAVSGDTDQSQRCYQDALAVWQRIEQAVPEHNRAQYPYYSGIACQQLGRYEQAIVYYLQVISKWPDYEWTWHARFKMAECLSALESSGKMDVSQSDSLRHSLYEDILRDTPDCPVAAIVRQKLNSNAQ